MIVSAYKFFMKEAGYSLWLKGTYKSVSEKRKKEKKKTNKHNNNNFEARTNL